MSLPWAAVSALAASIASGLLASPVASEPSTPRDEPLVIADAPPPSARPSKKSDADAADPPPLLATLVQLHTDEHVPLDQTSPPQPRFDALLADRVTGASHPLDPRLLGLLRTLASRHAAGGPPRIELVSGFRSPKLNEILRKKGHHVASHSQHSHGHAVDFRVVLVGETKGIAPRVLEKEIRALGWEGGVGVYLKESDWFVHADVGPNRNWVN